MRRKSLAQCFVKNSVAGFVGEVGEYERIHLPQGVGAAGAVEPSANRQHCKNYAAAAIMFFPIRFFGGQQAAAGAAA